jgi:thymidylate synthase (FAD)
MKIIEQSAKIVYPTSNEEETLLKLVESAGRNCYRSESGIDTYEGFIQKLIENKHESVLEFYDIAFELVTSRDVMAELTRHRHLSFCIESQRYVGHGGIEFIRPVEDSMIDMGWGKAMKQAEDAYFSIIRQKYGKQDARKILPNSTATRIYVKGNLREWRHVFELRTAKSAYPEMRQLMRLMLDAIRRELPITYDIVFKRYWVDIFP